jgi:translation initiation factor IF-2
MSEASTVKRLSKVATELNVGVQTVIDFLVGKGFDDVSRNSKVTDDQYDLLIKAYGAEKDAKEESKKIIQTRLKRETVALDDTQPVNHRHDDTDNEPEEVLVKNLNPVAERFKPEPAPVPKKEVAPEPIPEPTPIAVTPVIEVAPEPVIEVVGY